jgi:hypothetical protein
MESQMTDKRSRQDFMAFLDWIAQKGLMAPNTISARKAAVNKVLAILDDDDAQDVTALDVDDLMRRFGYREGKNYTPGSLQTYGSRLRAALDDFKAYVENPMSFRPGVQPRERRKPEPRRDSAPDETALPSPQTSHAAPPANALSIPIRPDKAILVQGLPYDLTEAEANKIANVIRAMALPSANS